VYAVPTVALGTVLVVMLKLEPGFETPIVYSWIAVFSGDEESCTWTVKVKLPVFEAEPEISPVALVRDSPAGRVPELRLQRYGALPPEAVRVAWYVACCCAADKLAVVMFRDADCAWKLLPEPVRAQPDKLKVKQSRVPMAASTPPHGRPLCHPRALGGVPICNFKNACALVPI
jgi:hypothetical protein